MSVTIPQPVQKPTISQRSVNVDSIALSAYFSVLIILGFIITSDKFIHWFVLPIFLCGVLVGADAIDWVKGRLDILDPTAIVGLLGVHFFFLAPLLHVHWDIWIEHAASPADWRDWLGGMAFVNFLGLLIYRTAVRRYKHLPSTRNTWYINQRRFFIIAVPALIATLLVQILVYRQFGGIQGYIDEATRLSDTWPPESSMDGMGFVYLFSESFPILAAMSFAVYLNMKQIRPSWGLLALAIIVFFILKMIFGGLRGSRSDTIWSMFWAIGIIHFWIRPISKKVVLAGCVFLLLFMYFYGFYKGAGLDSLSAFTSDDARTTLEETTDRNFRNMLLGDLGRSDVQALLLYRTISPNSDYQYAWGRTYYAAFTILIPRSIMDRPPNKSMEGTQALYGMDYYAPGEWVSSKLYGLSGEIMLNFGPFLVPLGFLLLGFLVTSVKQFMIALKPFDSRLLILPLLINLCFFVLLHDLDNVIFFLIKEGSLPFLILALSSQYSTSSESNWRHSVLP